MPFDLEVTEIQIAVYFKTAYHTDWKTLYNKLSGKYDIFDGLSFPLDIKNQTAPDIPRIKLASNDVTYQAIISPTVLRLYYNPLITNDDNIFNKMYKDLITDVLTESNKKVKRIGVIKSYFLSEKKAGKSASLFIKENFLKSTKEINNITVVFAQQTERDQIKIYKNITVTEGELEEERNKQQGVLFTYDINNIPNDNYNFENHDKIFEFITWGIESNTASNLLVDSEIDDNA